MITLQNHTEVAQHAYMETGHRHSLEPYEIRDLPEEIAQEFLKQRPNSVRRHTPYIVPPIAGEKTVWLGNMTGNPFAPETRDVFKLDHKSGIEEVVKVPNPLRKAVPVSRKLGSPQLIQEANGVKESFTAPPSMHVIPPYTRYPYPESIGEWMLRRDAQMDELSTGMIASVRAPTNFEPNDSWSANEILVYATMVDDSIDWFKRLDLKGRKDDQSKTILLQALCFKLWNPMYSLPTEPAFKLKMLDAVEQMNKNKNVQNQQAVRA